MFRDARTVEEGSLIERDLCVIGAGAVGITLALEFADSSHSVCLLESGGIQANPAAQELCSGELFSDFLPSASNYVGATRLRHFGGSTNHWTGFCRPLDPIDFEVRPWIAHSGWPFDHTHLEPYYTRAAALLEIHPWDYALEALAPERGRPLRFEPATPLETHTWHFSSPPTRFGPKHRDRLAAARRIEVYLHANAVELVPDRDATRVESVEVATLGGHRFRVKARHFVLAAGGLENPRLLLLSKRGGERGLGNAHDLVGRYFMDHLFQLQDPALAAFAETPEALAFYQQPWPEPRLGHPALGLLALAPDLQRKHRVPNHAFGRLTPLPAGARTPLGQLVGAAAASLARPPGEPAPSFEAFLGISTEPLPDPSNRVRLGDSRDALGLRRIRLDWNVTPADRQGIEQALQVFAAALGQSLRGRVRVRIGPGYDWSRLQISHHHVGTTRMHADPKRGVGAANGRVHGLANLYIGGSSVFPTAGHANPTFTILALTLRLADHLSQVLT
jgi:choline dehydrogenase-like flavoprotein